MSYNQIFMIGNLFFKAAFINWEQTFRAPGMLYKYYKVCKDDYEFKAKNRAKHRTHREKKS